MAVTFICKPFNALTTRELHDLLWLRELVFVVGQKITVESEIDGEDPAHDHVLGRDERGAVIATARLRFDSEPVKVGRIAVHPEQQHRGIGRSLMRAIDDLLGERAAEMHAQAHLESWYASLGWQRVGDIFLEAGIEHLRMIRSGRPG